MAGGFCLPSELTLPFKKALKDGTLDPVKLSEMDSATRHAEFAKLMGDGNAKEVNALFESKLLLKNQQAGMIAWAKSVADLKPTVMRDIVTKINKLDKVLSPADAKSFLADLAAKKMGTSVTLEEATKITELAKTAQAARDAKTEALSGMSNDALIAANNLRDYVSSLKPIGPIHSILRNISITGRNFLLMNPSTPLKTAEGQFTNSAMDLLTRRLSSMSLRGDNPVLVKQGNAEAWQTFLKTGDNTAAMQSLDDVGKLGEGKNFEAPKGMVDTNPVLKAGEAATRLLAKATTKVAIDWEHSYTFTKFYQKAFFDATNVLTSTIARSEGKLGAEAVARSAEIFKDAARIKPETDTGALVRMEAQKQAARVTSTNNTVVSAMATAAKKMLNDVGDKYVGGLKVGDYLIPIAKIPANILANGIENAGPGIPMGIYDIVKGRQLIASEDLQTRYQGLAQFSNGVQRLGRTIGVLTTAAYIVNQMTPQDFKQDPIYGTNYVKIAGVWVNGEYINAVSPALAGMMMVKQKSQAGQGLPATAAQYVAGTIAGLKEAPGVNELASLYKAASTPDASKGIEKYAQTFFTSRGEPAFIKSLLSGTPIQNLFFGSTGVQTEQQLQDKATAKSQAAAKTRAANKVTGSKLHAPTIKAPKI